MPIINGQKMACAPCIRGHRSTKCNHFNERVMVPVRKPGRPLSTCPCPPGRPCACGSVRVAIPKRQKCACPTDGSSKAHSTEQEQSPSETPSPSRSSFRVAKLGSSSKTRGRKQSVDATNLERMDPGSLNWISIPDGNGIHGGIAMVSSEAQGSPHGHNGFGPGIGLVPAGPGSPYSAPQSPSFGSPIAYSMGFQYPSSNQLRPGLKMEDNGIGGTSSTFSSIMPPPALINGNHAPPFVGVTPQSALLGAALLRGTNGNLSEASSCCSNKSDGPSPDLNALPAQQQGYGRSYMTQVQSPVETKANGSTLGGGGCCCNKKNEPSPSPRAIAASQQGYGQSYMSQFQPPGDMKLQSQGFQYPTVFTYPADYGSWQHPINPAIWQQVISQFSTTGGTSMPMMATTDGETGTLTTSHQCNCGDGCQCVGCLAHPFNAQMYQYVSDAYRVRTSNGTANGGGENGPSNGPVPGAAGFDATGQAQAVAGHDSPQDVQTPSEGTPGREEEALPTQDYCFVDLPLWEGCGGDLGSCPCGDSCECVGCLVHNNPLPQS